MGQLLDLFGQYNPLKLLGINYDILITVLDVIAILIFVRWTYKYAYAMKVVGIYKLVIKIVVFYFLASLFELQGIQILLIGTIFIMPLMIAFLYPTETRKTVDRFFLRHITRDRKKEVLTDKNMTEVAKAIIAMANNKIGGTIAIAKNDTYDDLIKETGQDLGEVNFDYKVILSFFESTALKHGTLIIRDNKIVACNVRMPVKDTHRLRMEQAGTRGAILNGCINEFDGIYLASREDTGEFMLAGHLQDDEDKKIKNILDTQLRTKKQDVQKGLTLEDVVFRLKTFRESEGEFKISEAINRNNAKKSTNKRGEVEARREQRKQEKEEKKRQRKQKIEQRKQEALERKAQRKK